MPGRRRPSVYDSHHAKPAPCRLAPTLALVLSAACCSSPRADSPPTCSSARAAMACPSTRTRPAPRASELRNFQTDPPAITVLPAPELTQEPPAPIEFADALLASSAPVKPPPATVAGSAGDPAERKFLRRGMTEGEVVGKVGPPKSPALPARSRPPAGPTCRRPGIRKPSPSSSFSKGVVTDVERKVSK